MKWRKANRLKRLKRNRPFRSRIVFAFMRMDWDYDAGWIRQMVSNALRRNPHAEVVRCVWNGELVGGYSSNTIWFRQAS